MDVSAWAERATEAYAAAVLAARRPDGHWGRGFYQPKWTSSHYTLLELRNLAIDPATPAPAETVKLILIGEKGPDGGINPSGTVTNSDACINAMALNYATYFGADIADLTSVVDFLLAQQMPDGGFNCRRNRSGARTSSVHTTVCMLEGATEYLRHHAYRADEVRQAQHGCAEYLLAHRMLRSVRTGDIIKDEFTRLHHPARWYYDILRGLDALADAGLSAADDPRTSEALDIIESRRRPDGLWAANRTYPGQTHAPMIRAGQPNPWVTLIAQRVLHAFGRS